MLKKIARMLPNKFDHLFIDADILVYRVGWTTNGLPESFAIARLENVYQGILEDTKPDNAISVLSATDKSNFRLDISADYKATRKSERPEHFYRLRDFFIEELGAVVKDGQEADDTIGILCSQLAGHTSVIASIDKDLLQIPSWHYNFVKKKFEYVSEIEGIRHFYWQLLVGDSGDNVKGISGIGPKRATRILEGCETEEEMFQTIKQIYMKTYQKDWNERLLKTGRLLKIRRTENELWNFPKEDQG